MNNNKYQLTTLIEAVRFDVTYETFCDIESLGVSTLGDLVSLEISNIINNHLINSFSKLEIVYLVHSLGYKFKDETVLLETKDKSDVLISLDTPLNQLTLYISSRTFKGLRRAGVKTLGDLVAKNKSDLLTVQHFGQKCLKETILFLHLLGYKFNEELENKNENIVVEEASIRKQIIKRKQENEEILKRINQKKELLQRYQELLQQRSALLEEEKTLDNEINQTLQTLISSVGEQSVRKVK